MTRHGRLLLLSIATCTAATTAVLTGCTPHTPTPHTSTPTATASATAASATAAPSSPSGVVAGCRSLPASSAVRTAVLDAYERASRPHPTHITPKGVFYYGVCDGTAFAATRFIPTSGATQQELVASQDEGAATKYFSKAPGQGWGYDASDGAPRNPRGCAAVSQIPRQLAAAWADCLEH
ncbi:hypothetical protein [Streptacidiphilus jiangxiensis]|uniref:Lipoprotein n=1 Tax=Streptacidiphilus jiangxiensis TaxID=235985 RepID=A0A1H7NZQ8_STRJI|nr:hypothetical protein [Streptacidiphilus jiangxiensis]SEL28866.1 hypothetical protein SAMN05414137_107145 [Streptacidiphilus jiangxiensis]